MDAYPEGVLQTHVRDGATIDEADIYEGGGTAKRAADELERQRNLMKAQQQFLTGETGRLEAPFSSGEIPRETRVRGAPEGGPPQDDFARAAQLQAAQQQAQAMAAAGAGEEEEAQDASKREGALKQASHARKTLSSLMDLFDAATFEDFVGGIMLILNTNAKLLTMGFKKNSIARKFFPAAQFPIEAFVYVSFDFLLIGAFMMTLVMLLAPMIIFMVVVGGGGAVILNVIDRLGG